MPYFQQHPSNHPSHHPAIIQERPPPYPRPALVGGAVSRAARADPLAVAVAVAVRRHAHALAADARDGLRRADEDLVDARRRDAAGKAGVAIGVKLALRVGVVVGRGDDGDGEVVVCGGVLVKNRGRG